MSTAMISRQTATPSLRPTAWLPLFVLYGVVADRASKLPGWMFMWALAVTIYGGLKWLTFADYAARNTVSFARSLGYLLLWPGMDATAFFSEQPGVRPSSRELLIGSANFLCGVVLMAVAIKTVNPLPLLGGWLGMAGVVFMLHFGLVRLVSVAWRRAGINARPIMKAPILAASLGEFWGQRWNLAFRDVAYAQVFRPMLKRCGIAGATMAVFLVSGVIHDVVISTAARAGYGLPTAYFVIQGCGVLFERSQLGKRIGIHEGLRGRLYAAVVVLGPVFLLFHRPFLLNVVGPMIQAIGGSGATP